VVWRGYDGSDWEIFLYDGATTTQITNNSNNDGSPQINDNGYVAWSGSDGSDDEIYLYDGTTTTNISNNSYGDYFPQINNNGYVIWFGSDGSDYEIYLAIFSPVEGGCICDLDYDGICDENDLVIFGDSHGWNDGDCNEPNVECPCDLVPNDDATCNGEDGAAFLLAYSNPECGYAVNLRRLRPRSVEPGKALRIIGNGFGTGIVGEGTPVETNSVVHVGPKEFEYDHPRVRLWTNTKIKIRLPKVKYTKNSCGWFMGADFRTQRVWVTVGGLDSNKKMLKILKPAGGCQ
jgi:hypothetical protein